MLRISTEAIAGPDGLRRALQDAIRLELFTIPPYLTALLTLSGSSPSVGYARRLIKDIVVEEMLHVNLACNILNALGGAPDLNGRSTVPRYPAPPPMGVAGGIEVHIQRYSRALVRDVLMEIEEPEVPLDLPVKSILAAHDSVPRTIGAFYQAIAEEIARLGDAVFVDRPERQVALGLFDPGEEIRVRDAHTALAAIDVIVRQGEGTPQSPLDLQGDIAHFYRLQELDKGMKLAPDPASPVKVSFDPAQPLSIDDADDVVAMVDDPQLVAIDPADGQAAALADECDRLYSAMLDNLHAGFNGEPDRVNGAIEDMYAFRTAARDLLKERLTVGPGAEFNAGPRFLYVP